MRYYASGETRLSTGNVFTDRLFTGQRQMAELGIYHFGARFYSPKLGRFLSADTIVPQPFNPQSLNRYSYALNNPLRYIDPSGHRICDDVDAYGNCITYDYGDEDSSGDGDGGDGDGGDGGDDEASDPLTVSPSSERTCGGCGDPRLLTGTLALLEGTVFAGFSVIAYAAVIGATGPIGIVLGAPFLFTAFVGADWAVYGAQEILYSGSDKEADPLILVHLFFPDLHRK